MKYQFSLLLSLGCFSSTSIAAFISSPAAVTQAPTPHNVLQYRFPTTTDPPSKDAVRRRTDDQVTLLAAPDNTCGYFSGSSDLPWGCSADNNCVFATASVKDSTTQTVGSLVCCDPQTGCPSTPVATVCAGNGNSEFTSACTGSCLDDPMTLKCTSGDYLFCNTISFTAPSISGLFCNTVSNEEPQFATTSYSGQLSHEFTQTVVQLAVQSQTGVSAAETTAATSTSEAGPSQSHGTSTSSPTESLNQSTTPSKGAIIGGCIGGIVALAFGIFAVIMVTRWFRPEYAENMNVRGHAMSEPSSPMREVNMRDSSMRDSSMRESRIRDSRIRDSSIRDSSIRDSSTMDSTTMDSSTLDTSIMDPRVRDSSIRDSSMRGSSIRGSTMMDPSVRRSIVRDTSMRGSIIGEPSMRTQSIRTNSIFRA